MELAIIEAAEAAEAARDSQEDVETLSGEFDLPQQRSNENQKVTCYICDKEFKTVSLKNRHLKIHFEPQYTCKFCGKRFKEIGNRNKHEQQVHTKQTFKCNKCGKQFKLQRSLKVHMQKKHSGEDDSDGAGAAEAPVHFLGRK